VPPELGDCPGGATPPLLGSAPPLLPPPPPLGVPVFGVPPDEGGVPVPPDAGGVAVPPLEGVPELGVLPPDEPPLDELPPEPDLLFFFLSDGVTGVPLVIGGTTGWVVCVLEFDVEPPPLDATAITTIRKNASTTTATSLRRR
jgi:hypothetical protein